MSIHVQNMNVQSMMENNAFQGCLFFILILYLFYLFAFIIIFISGYSL